MGEILTEAKDGKIRSIVDVYARKMYSFAVMKTKDAGHAEDIVQETFRKIIINIDKIGDIESKQSRGFIFKILENTILDFQRKHGLEQSRVIYTDDIDSRAGFVTDEYFAGISITGSISKYIELLDKDAQGILVFRYARDLSDKEIGQILNISEEAVRKRLSRARRQLKDVIEKYEGKRGDFRE